MSLVTITNACKSYNLTNSEKVEVLKSLTLQVESGEFVVFFGPNGCGKTTLLNAVAGIFKLDSGEIFIDGKSPRETKIGYVFQNYHETILPWMKVFENIAYPLRLRGISKKERKNKVKEILEKMNISLGLDKWPYQLSGGQQQLLVIARALISNPSLLLFDEPFNTLDFKTRLLMRDKIQGIWEQNRITTIFVTHELDEALLLANKVIMLSPRPTRILDIINVHLQRPRTQELIEKDNFHQLRSQVLKVFREAL